MLLSPLSVLRTVFALPALVARTGLSLLRTTSSGEPESAVTEAGGKAGGKYDQALFAAVANAPGITVAEAAQTVGVAASGLYPTVRRLEDRGLIEKRGRELHLR